VTSFKTHKAHIDEAADFYKDAMKNQGKLADIVVGISDEVIYDAKADDDEDKLIRAAGLKSQAVDAVKINRDLTSRDYTRPPEPKFDFMAIITHLLQLAGVGSLPLAVMAGLQKTKIGRLKQKGRMYASSTEVDHINGDPDFR